MNKVTFTIALIILFVSGALQINAQIKGKKDNLNALDYYKLIPSYESDFERSNAKLKIKDTKNGYLEFVISKGRMNVEVILYRKDDGKAILVVFTQNNDIENDITPNSIKAFELADSAYTDKVELEEVGNEVFPRLSSRENLSLFNQKRVKKNRKAADITLIYKLPRKGRTIYVTASNPEDEEDFESEVKLYELHLKNDKFIIVR